MASFQGFTGDSDYICGVLRHNERSNIHYSNESIDPQKTHLNYVLSPERDISPSEYFKNKLTEYWHYNRADVKLLDEWVITAPMDLSPEQEKPFFQACYDFLNQRYCGENNVVIAAVHKDESRRSPHMHYDFVPVTKNTNKKHKYEYKICNKAVVTRNDLRTFHDDLQAYLDKLGIDCTVHSGITRKLGGNLTVQQLKTLNQLEQQFSTEQLKKIMPTIEKLHEEYDEGRGYSNQIIQNEEIKQEEKTNWFTQKTDKQEEHIEKSWFNQEEEVIEDENQSWF